MKIDSITYLDYAAATPLAPHVLDVMQPYFSEQFYNPSSPYQPAVVVRRDYERAKQRLAEVFGAKGDELIMTAGATESINLAFSSIKGHVVTSNIEHPAVLEAAKRRDHALVSVSGKGMVRPEDVQRAIRPDTELVSIALANSEIGTIQPLKKIAAIIEAERQQRRVDGNLTPLLFHSDASQGAGQVAIHVARLGIDLLTLNASKMYGPKQVGLLWKKSRVSVTPVIVGGGQESGLRSGTENVAGVIGFAEAAEWVTGHRTQEVIRLKALRDKLEAALTDAVPQLVSIGDANHRLAGHLAVSFPGLDAERLVFLLEEDYIYVATGSACSANKGTASHVLVALGLDELTVNGSLRITLGKYTTEAMIDAAAEKISRAALEEYKRIGAR